MSLNEGAIFSPNFSGVAPRYAAWDPLPTFLGCEARYGCLSWEKVGTVGVLTCVRQDKEERLP